MLFKPIRQHIEIWNDNGRPHRKICVPECIWRSPKEVVKEFLRGLFEADGFNAYETSRVNLFSKHWEFLRDVQILLLGFGITARRATYKAKNGKGLAYTAQSLDLRSSEARTFNREIGFVGARKKDRSWDVEYKIGRPQLNMRMFDTVEYVEPVGEEEVFDITVEPTNLFSANGILVHNCTWQESFQTSGLCAFPKKLLQEIMNTSCCDPLWFGEMTYNHGAAQEIKLHLTPTFDEAERSRTGNVVYRRDRVIPPAKKYGGRFRVWEMPEPGEKYYVAGDPAHGLEGGDFSCAQIFRIGHGMEPDVQVAEWHGWINPSGFGHILVGLAKWYNEAELSLELNAVGELTYMVVFRTLEYSNLFRWKHYDKVKNFWSDYMAWLTTSKTRDLIISNMRERIMEKTVTLYSADLLDQMMDFSSEEEGSKFEGQNTNDDRVMACMICLWCAHDSDYGRTAAMAPKTDGGSKKYFVIDDLGRIVHTTEQKDEAYGFAYVKSDVRNIHGEEIETHAVMRPGWSVAHRPNKKDFNNSDYSPVHDKAGPRARIHAFGVPAESIRLDNIDEGLMMKESQDRDWMLL